MNIVRLLKKNIWNKYITKRKKNILIKKRKKIDIWGSPSVTHKTTNQTLSRLTSEFGWDPVRST